MREGDGEPTIREGIDFRLVRVSDKARRPGPFAAPPDDTPPKPFPPEEIAVRPVRRHPKGSSRTLAPAGENPAFRLDLRNVFPVDRPGRYRLEISFGEMKAADGSQRKFVGEFGVASPEKE